MQTTCSCQPIPASRINQPSGALSLLAGTLSSLLVNRKSARVSDKMNTLRRRLGPLVAPFMGLVLWSTVPCFGQAIYQRVRPFSFLRSR